MTPNPMCRVIKAESTGHSVPQGLTYFQGLSTETVGAQALCMHIVTIPPGKRGKAHMHPDHETMLYVLSGDSEMWYGENLSEYLTAGAGEFLYIPAGVPHLPGNRSQSEPCVAIVARTDPHAEEHVVLLPELEERVK